MNKALLDLALKAMGARNVTHYGAGACSFTLDGESVRMSGGQLILRQGAEGIADRLKVAYSRQVLGYQAKRNGWQLREVKPNVFQVIK
jgi:hypothetical protein